MCIYFDEAGKSNTAKTLEIALARAKELGIKKVVVASTHGETGLAALEAAKSFDVEVIVVPHQYGFRGPDEEEMEDDVQEKIRKAGGKLLFATMALGGVGKMPGCDGALVVANTLRMFCQGVKVSVEMTLMCADAGLVFSSEEIVVVAGTRSGADTACVIRPASTPFAWDREKGLKIRELLCRPR